MEEQENNLGENPVEAVQDGQFGLTDEEVKNYRVKNIWGRIKYYFAAIEPSLVKVFNTIIYWTLKILKSFVGSIFKMILGKEV